VTLVLGVPASDGVIVASDSQATSGAVRHTVQKIQRLTSRIVWAGAGEESLIQGVSQELAKRAKHDGDLKGMTDALRKAIEQSSTSLLHYDYRVPYASKDAKSLGQFAQAVFLFVESDGKRHSLLLIDAAGRALWQQDKGHVAIGSGDVFAHALLYRYRDLRLTCEVVAALAYRVLDEAIAVAAYGLGRPIDIWSITSVGVEQFDEARRGALRDSCELFTEQEQRILQDACAGGPDGANR